MIYAAPTIAAVAIAAIALAVETQAQTQADSPGRTSWDHNGSVMYLVTKGSSREFYYQKPRPGMLDAGAHPGSLLFRGEVNEGQYFGTAYLFNPHCGPIPFEVKGSSLGDEERIVLTGQAPRVGRDCRASGSYTSKLEFRRSKQDEPNQLQQAESATPVPAIEPSRTETKSDVSATKSGEMPRAPEGQGATRNQAPSRSKDSSASLADSKGPGTSTAPASIPDETLAGKTPEAKDLDKYLWGAAFIVMVVWLLIKLFGRALIGMK